MLYKFWNRFPYYTVYMYIFISWGVHVFPRTNKVFIYRVLLLEKRIHRIIRMCHSSCCVVYFSEIVHMGINSAKLWFIIKLVHIKYDISTFYTGYISGTSISFRAVRYILLNESILNIDLIYIFIIYNYLSCSHLLCMY